MSLNINNRIQLYSENTNMKYPLSDFHETAIPFDALVDMALSVPETYSQNIKMTNLVRTPTYAFVSLESNEEPIGHLFITNPVAFKIYPMTMFHKGTGWLVFGPAIAEEHTFKGVAVEIDHRCILPNLSTETQFKLSINGREYDMPNVLNIKTNYFLTSDKETREHDQLPAEFTPIESDCLTLGINGLAVSEDVLKYSMIDNDFADLPLFTINGVSPDANGNFNLALEADDIGESAELKRVMDTASGRDLGFVAITGGVEGCVDPYKELNAKIKPGKEGYGVAYDLPLDDLIPYESSSSSSS